MKRNKIFLGATASLLALAGIIAAKQQKLVVRVMYTTANVDCTVVCSKTAIAAVTTGHEGQAKAYVNGHLACYTIDAGEACLPLWSGL